MNTSKQINLMVLLIFALLIGLGVYTLYDPLREQDARVQQEDVLAQRGAAIFAQNCRPCHGDVGQGRVGPALNRPDLRDQAKLDQIQAFVRDTISCGRVGTLMPTWGQVEGGPLNDEQIRDLVTLITVDPKDSSGDDAWTRYVKPDSEAANKVATPLAVEEITKGSLTGSQQSVCGQKVAVAVPLVPATPGVPTANLSETATDNKFSETSLTVPTGLAITMNFANQGNAIHNWHVTDVKDDAGKDITTGANGSLGGRSATLSFTVSKTGSYKFQCDFHPTEMLGTLFVVAPGGAAPGSAPVGATPAAGAPGGGASQGTGPSAPSGSAPQAPASATPPR